MTVKYIKWNIDKVKKEFEKRNFILLSNEYINYSTKLECECSICGNKFEIDMAHLMGGRSCPVCGLKKNAEKLRKYSFEELKEIYKKNNSKLLTKEKDYKNSKQKLKYICPYCGFKAEMIIKNFLKGCRCSNCRKNKKYIYKEVEKIFEKKGCKLLEKKYKNNKQRMLFQCRCKNIDYISLDSLLSGHFCWKCGVERRAEKQRYFYEEVKKIFEDNNCVLLSKEYKNSKQKLDYICECENKAQISLNCFLRGNRCPECRKEKVRKKLSYTYQEVKDYFESQGCELLSTEYINAKIKLEYICVCNKKAEIAFWHFVDGGRCQNCKRINATGPNSPCYNPNLTDEERKLKRLIPGYIGWRNYIYEKDNYTCQCCGKNKCYLNAHHIESYDINVDLRLDKNNGITWCKDCHQEFHKIYGFGNNNRKQFEEFSEVYKTIP